MVAERKGEQRPSPPLPLPPVLSNIQREFRLPLSPSRPRPSPMRNEMRISQPKETTKATEEDDLI